ncbi:MAG: hypothetical protein CM1200mP26_20520 [Acidimicrobiales bacterium]|nr:MAG: hypothetical protein CM1200mP26_20520 [Acidimicrobiales bacterium]
MALLHALCVVDFMSDEIAGNAHLPVLVVRLPPKAPSRRASPDRPGPRQASEKQNE